jgi:Acyl-CoA thioesterase
VDLASLLELLELEQLEDRLFRGRSHPTPWGRVFGGQVLAQALLASAHTVPEDRIAHSMHGYFILGGDVDKPIVYDVDRIRDGGSFTTRRSIAIQKGEAMFNSATSFQVAEQGIIEHQIEIPEVPGPEELPSSIALSERYRVKAPALHARMSRQLPIEVRPVDDYDLLSPEDYPPLYRCWVKADGPMPDDRRLHQAVLAYASDYHLLTTAVVPHLHKLSFPRLNLTSLDHAIWFHEEVRVDDWLLFVIDSPRASRGRGFTRASVYDRRGSLVCSVAQEGLIRERR